MGYKDAHDYFTNPNIKSKNRQLLRSHALQRPRRSRLDENRQAAILQLQEAVNRTWRRLTALAALAVTLLISYLGHQCLFLLHPAPSASAPAPTETAAYTHGGAEAARGQTLPSAVG